MLLPSASQNEDGFTPPKSDKTAGGKSYNLNHSPTKNKSAKGKSSKSILNKSMKTEKTVSAVPVQQPTIGYKWTKIVDFLSNNSFNLI